MTISVALLVHFNTAIAQQSLKTIGPKEARYSWQAMYLPGEAEPDYSMSPIKIDVIPGKYEYMWGEPIFVKIVLTNDRASSLAGEFRENSGEFRGQTTKLTELPHARTETTSLQLAEMRGKNRHVLFVYICPDTPLLSFYISQFYKIISYPSDKFLCPT